MIKQGQYGFCDQNTKKPYQCVQLTQIFRFALAVRATKRHDVGNKNGEANMLRRLSLYSCSILAVFSLSNPSFALGKPDRAFPIMDKLQPTLPPDDGKPKTAPQIRPKLY